MVDGPTLSVGPIGEVLSLLVEVPEQDSSNSPMLTDPVWSPDGKALAFVHHRVPENEREVVVVEPSGRIAVTGSGVVLQPLFLADAVVFTQCGTDGCRVMVTDLGG